MDLPCEFRVVEFDEENFQADLTDGNVTATNHGTILLIPKNKKLDSADALMLPDICLQFTIKAKSHFIAATFRFIKLLDEVRTFCKKIGLVSPDKFRYIFVVPDFRYDNFGSQAVQCNEDLSEKALVASIIGDVLNPISSSDQVKITSQLLKISRDNKGTGSKDFE